MTSPPTRPVKRSRYATDSRSLRVLLRAETLPCLSEYTLQHVRTVRCPSWRRRKCRAFYERSSSCCRTRVSEGWSYGHRRPRCSSELGTRSGRLRPDGFAVRNLPDAEQALRIGTRKGSASERMRRNHFVDAASG